MFPCFVDGSTSQGETSASPGQNLAELVKRIRAKKSSVRNRDIYFFLKIYLLLKISNFQNGCQILGT